MDHKEQLEVIKYLLLLCGGLLSACGGFIFYIFSESKCEVKKLYKENREDHAVIFERLDRKVDKE